MHPQHFFDQQLNKSWPEINLKRFVLNVGFTCFLTQIWSYWIQKIIPTLWSYQAEDCYLLSG